MKRTTRVTLLSVGFTLALAPACAFESTPPAASGATDPAKAQLGMVGETDEGCTRHDCQSDCVNRTGSGATVEEDAVPEDAIPLGDSPRKGADDADVVIVLSSDFECPFCARVNPVLERVMAEYGNRVAVVYKHNPLAYHHNAMSAAMAAEAARRQGHFWEMYDLLFANQSRLDREHFLAWAEQLGLDTAAFEVDLDSRESAQRIEHDRQLIESLGGTGVPTLWINGRRLEGAQPFERVRAVIDAELKE